MKCILCGSNHVQTTDTVISDFIMARICPDFQADCGMNKPVRLCFCKACTFAFYDYRITDAESELIYLDYRGEKYQKTRQKYEYWYTAKVNTALNEDKCALHEQRSVIATILRDNTDMEIKSALDYGGNEGRTFFKSLGTQKKYVFDISGIKTVKGVTGISDFEELKQHHYDFIMCNQLFEHLADFREILSRIRSIGSQETLFYIEVPSENPFTRVNKFSVLHNIGMMVNPLFSPIRLVRSYLRKRRQPFMPMHEHINFFTPRSMRIMLERSGFSVMDLRETPEKTVLGTTTVLSALFRINPGAAEAKQN